MSNEGTFLLPPQASTYAQDVDSLYYFIHYLSVFFWVLIAGAIVYFAWRYRPGHKEGAGPSHSLPLELTWTVIPLILVIAIFLWGFKTYMVLSTAPGDAKEIYVTAHKWRWDFEDPDNGIRTTNEITVPVNTPIKMIMTSSDVIHSFFVPTFRNKMDVVPGRKTSFWFEATKLGEQDLYCAEFCGDGHSVMLGKINVVTPEEYEEWVAEQSVEDTTTPLPELGEKLYTSKTCFTCHSTDGSASIGPTFHGLFGRDVELNNGSKVTADEEYLRESILNPNAKVVKGYQPVMPPFQGQLSEREIDGLIEYIKSLK